MKAQTRLEEYLRGFRLRLRALILARGVAVLCAAALAVTLLAVMIGTRQAFPDGLMNGARLFLALSLGAVAALLLIRPLQVLRRTRGVADIEKRAPDFDGRIETYDELARGKRHDPRQPSPFLGLLAEDALRLARAIPAALRVRSREIAIPGALAAVALGVLVWFAAYGPDNWRYGVRHVWAGWVMADTLPPQRIVVSPGDGAVRRGGDLAIDARAEGFDPVAAQVFALFEGSEDWESAPMLTGDEDDFEFTFYAVREPVRYYVVAAGVHSEEFLVGVVDLPRVRNVKLTYHYPRWTQLESETVDPGSDIRAVAGTRVEVEVTTDQPLGAAELIVNGETLAMTTDGAVAAANLEVSESGEYFISTFFNDDPVRLTDDYFIDAIPDTKPAVDVVRPGRDWRASNIEEVSVRVEASDDFALDRLELHYAINGGDWNVVELDTEGAYALSDEILYLEEMGKTIGADNLLDLPGEGGLPRTPDDPVAVEVTTAALEPGDLISYYAQAHDRDASERTDLYFVEVQPFERTYSQSMQGGGGGGGGGGGEQNEISQRQKEILVATWNLIRKQEELTGFRDEQQLEDNARMLGELQRTLAQQAQTLANRTRARQLTAVDEQIQTFVNSLESAAAAMRPAADRLDDIELDQAVPSEQEALQHLLKAESVFTDIQVSFQQGGGGGGGGGFAGRDLAELFELEMDLEKNQYETESAVSFENTPEAEFDEAIAKLQELARRQENLARQAARQQELTEQERWQQEQLRRETEELRRELEELRQAAAQQQAQQGGQQQGGQQQGGQQQGGQQSGQQGGLANATTEAIRQLDNALQAMDRAQSQGEMTPEQAQRAIEQARRQLDSALDQLTDQRQAAAEEAFSDLTERAETLLDEQRRIAAELQQVANESFRNRDGNGARQNPLSYEEAIDMSERKWAMQEDLEALEEDIQGVANQFRPQTPGASEELYDALADLQQTQAALRLGAAAARIRRGLADELAPFEGVTTAALEDLRRDTEQALATASREAREGQQQEQDATSELVAELQALRRELAQFQNGAAGQQAGGGAQGGNRFGPGGGRGIYDPNRRGLGFWDPTGSPLSLDPEARERLEAQLQAAGRDLLSLGTRLRAEDELTAAELEAIRRLGDALRSGLSGNPELIEQEYLAMLNLMEQLELELAYRESGEGETAVRTQAPAGVAAEYEEAVAEYFRRLSRSEEP